MAQNHGANGVLPRRDLIGAMENAGVNFPKSPPLQVERQEPHLLRPRAPSDDRRDQVLRRGAAGAAPVAGRPPLGDPPLRRRALAPGPLLLPLERVPQLPARQKNGEAREARDKVLAGRGVRGFVI